MGGAARYSSILSTSIKYLVPHRMLGISPHTTFRRSAVAVREHPGSALRKSAWASLIVRSLVKTHILSLKTVVFHIFRYYPTTHSFDCFKMFGFFSNVRSASHIHSAATVLGFRGIWHSTNNLLFAQKPPSVLLFGQSRFFALNAADPDDGLMLSQSARIHLQENE